VSVLIYRGIDSTYRYLLIFANDFVVETAILLEIRDNSIPLSYDMRLGLGLMVVKFHLNFP